jgi:hypothetical protein
MKALKKLPYLVSALSLAFLAGCNGGGASDPATDFVNSLNSIDPSYQYQLVKSTTNRGGNWIVVSQSSFYVDCTDPAVQSTCRNIPVATNNFAIDFSDPTKGSYANDVDFFNNAGLGVGYNNSTGLYFDQYGNTYEKRGGVIKDINVLGAQAQTLKKAIYAREIMARYGLSEERSLSLAKMGMDLQYLAKKNGGTLAQKDKDAFEKFAFGGVKVSEMREHLQTGNAAALKQDKEAIARANQITTDDVSYLLEHARF